MYILIRILISRIFGGCYLELIDDRKKCKGKKIYEERERELDAYKLE